MNDIRNIGIAAPTVEEFAAKLNTLAEQFNSGEVTRFYNDRQPFSHGGQVVTVATVNCHGHEVTDPDDPCAG